MEAARERPPLAAGRSGAGSRAGRSAAIEQAPLAVDAEAGAAITGISATGRASRTMPVLLQTLVREVGLGPADHGLRHVGASACSTTAQTAS